MTLNITLSSIIYLSFSSLPITACLITSYQYYKLRYRHAFFHAFGWFFIALWTIFWGLGNLFLSPPYIIMGHFALIPLAIFLVLLQDSIMRERIDPIKLILVSVIGTSVVFTAIAPGSTIYYIFPNGELALFPNQATIISLLIMICLAGSSYFYTMLKIFLNSPKTLKKFSLINLFAGFTSGIFPIIILISGLPWVIPGIFSIVLAIGALFCSIAWALEPRLGFVLPFKARRLTVIQTKSGSPLFTHVWAIKSKKVDDILFSGMLNAISSFVEETLESGNVQEVHLKQGILILRKSDEHPIVCVLVTDRSTRTLRDAFYSFANQFFQKFAKYATSAVNLKNFETATELVGNNFSFVPEYD